MPDLVRVFISYSHDSEAHRERVRELAARLRGHGIDAWMDQFTSPPVEGWPRWTEQQFAGARFIIVACTEPYAERFNAPPSSGSGVGWEATLIRQELYDQGVNTRFVPVYFDDDAKAVPLVLRPYPRYLLPRDYEQLRQHLMGETKAVPPLASPPTFEGARPGASGLRAPVQLWNVPPRPAQYLPRDGLDALKVSLISSRTQTVAIAGEHHRLGIQGMPGVGKTVLAAALAADADIHEAFPGGVFWLTLGRTPDDVAVWQGKLAQALAGHPIEVRTAREGKATLGELFAARPPSLLILDDVWNVADADPFDAPAAPSRLLITTRNQEVAKGLGATVREIRELKPADALAMLAAYAGRAVEALPKVAHDLVRECGELPLAVAMAGAMLQQDRPEDQWPTLLEQLKSADLEYLAAALPQYRQHRSMLAAIEVSVQDLPEDVRLRYLDFAVFPEDTEVPERVLHRLWVATGAKLFTAQQTVNMLADRSLVRRVRRARSRDGDRCADQPAPSPKDEEVYLTLHDLQHDYVRARGGELAPRHARLVEAYRSTSPDKALHAVAADGYFFEHIARHVRDGEGAAALRALLFDHRWLAAKLNAAGVNALIADFELLDLVSETPLRLLRDALRLSSHVLARHPEELHSQLLGRLRGAPEHEFHRLCIRVEADAASPSLLPVWSSLERPGGPLLRTLEGHAGPVNAVVLSADGRTAVSGSTDRMLKVWDVETGQVRHKLEAHVGSVNAVVLSPDEKTAVSGSTDRTLKVWDVETGQLRRTLEGHAGPVNAVVLSADGRTAVSGSADRTLKLWDVETGQVLRTLEGHVGRVNAVALSADGTTLVSGSGDLKVWDVETGQVRRTLEGHGGWVNAVMLSADGEMAISGSTDGTLKVWDVKTGQVRRTLEGHADEVNSVVLSADRKTAVSSSEDETLKVWDTETGQVRWTLEAHDDSVNAVALNADGNIAVSGADDGTLKVWNIKTGQERRTPEGHADWVNAVVLSVDGETAISGARDRTLKVWDIETGKVRRTLQGHTDGVNVVALSVDGKTIVSGSFDGRLKAWDVETGQVRRTLEGHVGGVNAVVLSADGKMAVSCSDDRTPRVWDLEMGQVHWTLEGHVAAVNTVVLSADEKTVVSGSDDGTLKVWDVKTGQVRRTLEGHAGGVTAVVLSADGETTVSGSDDKMLRVWDVETGQMRWTLQGHAGWVNAVVLSADGKTAVSGSTDRTLRVWDIETGKVRRTLEGHTSGVGAVILSVDEKTVVSGSDDGTLKVWDIESGNCLASFTGDAAFTTLALSERMRLLAGDSAGHVHLLELRLAPEGPEGRVLSRPALVG